MLGIEKFEDGEGVMAGEVITVYAGQRLPESWDASIVIGGPAPEPDSSGVPWHAEVIRLLQERWVNDGRLVLFVIESGRCVGGVAGEEPANWRSYVCDIADVLLFWWPGDADPRLMSASLAAWNDSRRVVHGAPPETPLRGHLTEYAGTWAISTAATLAELADAALGKIGKGARRVAGERDVPLAVWRSDSFHRWYSAQSAAGNVLRGARQVWTFSAGPGQSSLIYWALHVRVYIQAEDRVKSNEVVISRPDISVMALYRRGTTLDDTTIVLVREFRSPASTPDGLVHELPGGSTADNSTALDQAITETEEETGLTIAAQRIRTHGSRQLVATMSAHHAHLFSAEITSDEIARLRAAHATPHGAGDTERTWPEVTTFGELRDGRLVDWATLGMVAEVVLSGHSQASP